MKWTPSPQDRKIIQLLEALKAIKAEYPPEMLARRRTTYMVQLALMEKFSVKNFNSIEDEKIIEVLENLKPVKAEYPSILMAKQRAAFLDQAAKRRKAGRIESLRSAIRSKLSFTPKAPAGALTNAIRRSFILATIIAAVFAGILFGNLDQFTESARPQPTRERSRNLFPLSRPLLTKAQKQLARRILLHRNVLSMVSIKNRARRHGLARVLIAGSK